jgi:hypothetical protein
LRRRYRVLTRERRLKIRLKKPHYETPYTGLLGRSCAGQGGGQIVGGDGYDAPIRQMN